MIASHPITKVSITMRQAIHEIGKPALQRSSLSQCSSLSAAHCPTIGLLGLVVLCCLIVNQMALFAATITVSNLHKWKHNLKLLGPRANICNKTPPTIHQFNIQTPGNFRLSLPGGTGREWHPNTTIQSYTCGKVRARYNQSLVVPTSVL